MTDEVIEAAADFIAPFEGLKLKPYLCPAGVPTIGYGTTRHVTLKMPPITKDIARQWLIDDIKTANAAINAFVEPLINKNQKIALLSFVHNLGSGNFKKSTLLRRINEKNFEGAAREFEKWVFANGKKLRGLVKRRMAEKQLFLTPTEGELHG